MKNFYTLIVSCVLSVIHCTGQTHFDNVRYKRILYRINVGGIPVNAHDNTTVNWQNDNFSNPSPFSNFGKTKNKVYTTNDTILFDPSVPEGTPVFLFQNERAVDSSGVSGMEWDFPVEEGKKVEIRLYFAEIFFRTPGSRVFDILIDSVLTEDNLDLTATYGFEVGAMKKYEITSDGNVDVDFRKEVNNPTLAALEIFELNEITGLTEPSAGKKLFASPNPFEDFISIKIPAAGDDQKIEICDLSGVQVLSGENIKKAGERFLIDTGNLRPGFYLLRVGNHIEKVFKK